VSPNMVTPGASGSSIKVTVSTTAPSQLPLARWKAPHAPHGPLRLPAVWLALAAALSLLGLARKRNRRAWAVLTLAALAVCLWASCGGGGGGSVATPGSSGTAPGTYGVTVTGTAGSLTQSTSLTLKVQ
jgi:hypothetical protein